MHQVLLRKSVGFVLLILLSFGLAASSHREAPLIADDPLADNTDVYAFRSPDDPTTITILASYIPMQLPQGGPNYYTFGEDVRYEIHVDNNTATPGDDITYRFTFTRVNEDPTTFFNVRFGENIKATYTLERSLDGGASFDTILEDGIVPPYNIGPRSIEGGGPGLNTTYEQLMENAISSTSTGETVWAGPSDDPFFVDLGGIFDLGDSPRQGEGQKSRDGLAQFNVHTIALKIPITTLLKADAPATPTSILDANYVIGVWASASRPAVRTLTAGDMSDFSGDWVQVSRLGMPLTNEAVIPIGQKDYWNSISPYDEITDTRLDSFFYNPELALYMDDDQLGQFVPAFAPLRVQKAAKTLLGEVDFSNGADGLFILRGNAALNGTALGPEAGFQDLLLPRAGAPRSVDLWPIFHTGVPNLSPYQLAAGKTPGNPLSAGKPFINNFLPNGGDMLRLNMAVPVTPRDSEAFNSLGLIQAAVLGLTNPEYNGTTTVQNIPNMDGFPNGRRLEDDVTRIELQAVAGVVLAAIGLGYDDRADAESGLLTQDLLDVLGYTTEVEENDRPFSTTFPYVAMPWRGTEVDHTNPE